MFLLRADAARLFGSFYTVGGHRGPPGTFLIGCHRPEELLLRRALRAASAFAVRRDVTPDRCHVVTPRDQLTTPCAAHGTTG
ncbi:hypothetical protein [Pseudonocardia sp. GCM10023141]|uniref:hypothetical protein n=1 Tax=Pseudonocardia sp. GCM10023141 TaxID=3252653 RepID=UPI00361B5468